MFTEIVPGVFSVAHRFVDGKNGIVIGAKGALAIDACNYPDEGQAMANFIRDKGRKPNRLALTHGHGDHILGGAAFADAEIFAHAGTPEVIRRQLSGWAARSGESEAQVKDRVVWPTVTFTDQLCIDLGEKRVCFFPTPGHSEDGVCAFIESERVLFAGDTVSTGIVPAFGDGNSIEMESSLHKLAEMEIDVLVPGHGGVLRGAKRSREWILWLIRYLSNLRAFVRDQLDEGHEAEAIMEAADYQEFIGDRLPVAKHGMPKRHRSAVEKIIEEELERRRVSTS